MKKAFLMMIIILILSVSVARAEEADYKKIGVDVLTGYVAEVTKTSPVLRAYDNYQIRKDFQLYDNQLGDLYERVGRLEEGARTNENLKQVLGEIKVRFGKGKMESKGTVFEALDAILFETSDAPILFDGSRLSAPKVALATHKDGKVIMKDSTIQTPYASITQEGNGYTVMEGDGTMEVTSSKGQLTQTYRLPKNVNR